MVHFVGAGPGDRELITLRGKKQIEEADVIIYTGSLINTELLEYRKPGCRLHDSARLTLSEVIAIMEDARDQEVVRLHTGDPCIYGAIREQMDELDARMIAYDVTPGVSSFCAAAASLQLEYTLPGISQSVIITRMEGRTGVPERESVEALAMHEATMVFFLSAGEIARLERRLLSAGRSPETPCALIYRASWTDEKKCICTLSELAATADREGINRTALIIVGEVIRHTAYEKSKLYDPDFTTGYRCGADRNE